MSTKIAAINGKGGCAKTTSLYHLTGVLANQGKKILAVDFDKQCNFSNTLLLHSQKPDQTIYDLRHLMINPALIRKVPTW